MNTEAIFDAIKLGVEYIMIAVFIGLAIKVVSIRNSYAETLNEQEISASTIRETLEFSMYNTGTDQNDRDEWMTGDEVIACFRKYRSGEIQVYLDKTSSNTSLLLNRDTAHQTTSDNKTEVFSLQNLLQIIDTTKFYHPYLVYDNENIANPSKYSHSGDYISGIAFIRCN